MFKFDNNILIFFLISLIFHIIACYYNVGFYKIDEHFSILEPVNFKLDKVATLGWDFFQHYDRSWFLPWIYYTLTKLFIILDINNPFYWSLGYRLFSSLIGWISLICLFYIGENLFKNQISEKLLIYSITFLWFFPFLHSRTSSENLGGSLLVIGVTFFLFANQFKYKKFIFFTSGLFLGMAFLSRFPLGVSILGFGIWALIFTNSKFLQLFLCFVGIVTLIFIGILIDFWGYGQFEFTPLNYYLFNGLQLMNYFPSYPWWYFLNLLVFDFLPPISLIIIFSIIVFWIRSFKNFITWLTLPSFIFLCTIPSKELRFLFPILIFSPIFLSHTYFFIISNTYFNRINTSILIKFFKYFFIFINFFALIIFMIIPANNDVKFYKYLYNNFQGSKIIYTLDDIPYRQSDLMNTFYNNYKIQFVSIINLSQCNDSLFINNNLDKTNYDIFIKNNKEFDFSEIQNFSTPKWKFDYKILCNKEQFMNQPIKKNNKFYIFSSSKYLDKFNKNKNNCDMIYSTIPSFMIKYNYENWINRLSNWFVYKC